MSDFGSSIKSKWLCLYYAKGRARYLDVFKLYVDGSLDKFPTGSICLDDPMVLLDTEHPNYNALLPSELAKSCDLFADETCYSLIELVEQQIAYTGNHAPLEPLAYVIAGVDSQFRPEMVIGLEYHKAMTLFADHAETMQLPMVATASDPSGSLCAKFGAHALDLRIDPTKSPKPRKKPPSNGGFFSQ